MLMPKMDAVRKYGALTQHEDDGQICVTNEWIAGTFAGRGFSGDTFEEAAQDLIDYLDEHIGHASIVGDAVRAARWTSGATVDLDESKLLFQPEIELAS